MSDLTSGIRAELDALGRVFTEPDDEEIRQRLQSHATKGELGRVALRLLEAQVAILDLGLTVQKHPGARDVKAILGDLADNAKSLTRLLAELVQVEIANGPE